MIDAAGTSVACASLTLFTPLFSGPCREFRDVERLCPQPIRRRGRAGCDRSCRRRAGGQGGDDIGVVHRIGRRARGGTGGRRRGYAARPSARCRRRDGRRCHQAARPFPRPGAGCHPPPSPECRVAGRCRRLGCVGERAGADSATGRRHGTAAFRHRPRPGPGVRQVRPRGADGSTAGTGRQSARPALPAQEIGEARPHRTGDDHVVGRGGGGEARHGDAAHGTGRSRVRDGRRDGGDRRRSARRAGAWRRTGGGRCQPAICRSRRTAHRRRDRA